MVTQEYYADIKSRLARYGRAPESQLQLAGVTILTAPTEKEAKARAAEVERLAREADWDPRLVAADLSLGVHSVPLDVPLSKLDALADALEHATPADLQVQNAMKGGNVSDPSDLGVLTHEVRNHQGEEDVTLRDVYTYYVKRHATIANSIVGDPVQVADWLEEKFETYELDGVTTFVPYLPAPLYDFVDLVIPEMQRRGRFRKDYDNTTIRERWGLEERTRPWAGC